MNIMERGATGLARLEYLDGDFRVLAPGEFVLCAVSGKRIPVDDLRYWNVDRQEAYASYREAMQRFLELRQLEAKS
jgi:hypothetical protein